MLIESPYKSDNIEIIRRNLAYARIAANDCIKRGEFPYGSHIFFTQPGILDDKIDPERMAGIQAGLRIASFFDVSAFYKDLGISEGMEKYGLTAAHEMNRIIEERTIPGWKDRVVKLYRAHSDGAIWGVTDNFDFLDL